MNPGGLNNFRRDSFAPSPQVDLMWHISNPNTPPPRPQVVDSHKPAESDMESYLTEGKTNKSLVIFMKSCKVFFYIAFGPPYLLFIRFPVALKRFSFPLIKRANRELLDALKKNYAKVSNGVQKFTDRASALLVRFSQNVSRLAEHMKSGLDKQMEALKTEINRYLNPTLDAAQSMARMIARFSAASLEQGQALASKLLSLKNGLKGFSIPKIFAQGRNRLETAFSQANEGLQAAWNLVKESAEKTKAMLAKKIEDAKNNLGKLKNWSSEQAKKVKKQAEVVVEVLSKVVTPVLTVVKETFIQPMHAVVNVMQHPYFAAITMASTIRGAAERSLQSVLRAFNDKMQLAKVVILNAGNALLMPFKRGFSLVKRQAQKVLNKMQQSGKRLMQKFQEQGQSAKKRLMEYAKKLIAKSKIIYDLLKRLVMRVFHGLKLFWIWVKLMSSFAAFLMRQLFREVLASLK